MIEPIMSSLREARDALEGLLEGKIIIIPSSGKPNMASPHR
jgi:hypothetical protein